MRLRGGQYKHDMGRRLFQCLEQGIECAHRQHMDFIYDIDLIFPDGRRKSYLIAQIANLIHPVVGRGVDLHNVHIVFRRQIDAGLAFATGTILRGRHAVDGSGKYLGCTGFPGATGSAEQVCMGNMPAEQLILQRLDNGILPYHIPESIRTPLPVKRCIHWRYTRLPWNLLILNTGQFNYIIRNRELSGKKSLT